MLLWHTWNETEAEAFNGVIESFIELYPDVTIKQQAFASLDEMAAQFAVSRRSGLGPDTILAPSDWVQPLAETAAIDAISGRLDEETLARYSDASLTTLRVGDQLYGLPVALDTLALYYHQDKVEAPATSLDELLDQANAGAIVMLPSNFYDAFWGIQAFGGQLFDEEGRVILNQGGFANWLAWLRDARDAPGMIQDSNREVLRSRFIDSEAAYYFGYASELNAIISGLGAENVGVVPLPAGPISNAGPLLSSRAFLFSPVSSQNQRRLAVEFAKFATNSEQSARLMRLARYIPANIRVRINPRLNPVVAAFAAQTRSALPVPALPQFAEVLALGNEAYNRVLELGETPAEVAFSFTNQVNEANGFAAEEAPTYACTNLGTLRLLHSWTGEAEQAALDALIQRFRAACPLVIVERRLVQGAAPDYPELVNALANATGRRATVALIDQAALLALMQEPPLIENLTPHVPAETLQRFWPSGVDAMRLQGNLYGVPLALQVNALYYNRQLVEDPAQVLDELRAQASEGIPITLDTRFAHAFWGIGAFGGQLFNDEYRAILDQGGFVEWLTWLREARDAFGIQVSNDPEELLARFVRGESAYFVGDPSQLATLQAELGDNLGVAQLPAGPAGPGRPLVRAMGLVVGASDNEDQITLALEFVRFLTDVESQEQLMTTLNLLPANATVDTANVPVFAAFAQQLQTGYLVPNSPNFRTVAMLGGRAYIAVLEEGVEPETAVAAVTALINETNGFEPLSPIKAEDASEDEADAGEDNATEATAAPDQGIDTPPVSDEGEEEPDAGTNDGDNDADGLDTPPETESLAPNPGELPEQDEEGEPVDDALGAPPAGGPTDADGPAPTE